MRIRISRLVQSQTRYGIFQNLTCPIDRQAIGGWYLTIHCAPLYIELYG